jgi:FAD/FMN-containing dehydrogenase
LYGPQGFLQYQFAIPITNSKQSISEVLKKIHASGKGPLLSVLKKFGEGNNNYLSFPFRGYSLALDFKKEVGLFPLLAELDEIILANGGRLYLAKDARMTEDVFKRSYLDWEKFLNVKSKVDPNHLFASLQSNRIGLT